MRTTFKIASLLIILFTSCVGTLQAQEKRQWTKEMLEYKHNYLVSEVEMSTSQRDKFLPLYQAMEKEIFSVYRNARDQAKKVSGTSGKASDNEYYTAAKTMAEVKYKVGEIENRYFNQFAKILSKKQLFLLKKAELKFTKDMVGKRKK